MKGIVELVLSFCDLLEAEGELFRQNALLTTRRCVLLAVGIFFGAAAVGFLVAALYAILTIFLPQAATFAIIGVLCALICCVFLWSSGIWKSKASGKSRKEKKTR